MKILFKVVPLDSALILASDNPFCSFVKEALKASVGERVFREDYISLERFLATNWDTSCPKIPCPSATANRLWFSCMNLVLIRRLSWLGLYGFDYNTPFLVLKA